MPSKWKQRADLTLHYLSQCADWTEADWDVAESLSEGLRKRTQRHSVDSVFADDMLSRLNAMILRHGDKLTGGKQ